MSPAPRLSPALAEWCQETLGEPPAEVFFHRTSMSRVYGVTLADRRKVALKVRSDDPVRATRCAAAHRALHDSGFPCPAVLSEVATVDGETVHAEEWAPEGGQLQGTGDRVTAAFARLLAELVTRTAALELEPPQPAPIWAAWDHPGPGLWPDDGVHLPDSGHARLPAFVVDVAARVRRRLAGMALPCVIGHADWETQNIRWSGGAPLQVHDWDSLAWRPEAAIAGLAAATFPSDRQPVVAPLDTSARFLAEYQAARGVRFDAEEIEVAWAAGLWLAAHNARMEAVYDKPPLVIAALRVQAEERLRRAGA